MSMRPLGSRSAGFSLIEVLVSVGMLAGVLIAVAGLLTLAGKQVKSGRSNSEALAVARDIVEEVGGWGFHQTYSLFGEDGTATEYTIRSDSLLPSDYIWQDPGDPTWQEILERTLFNAWAEIHIESLAGNLEDATEIRVTATVFWSESARNRSVQLATVKM